MESLWAKLNVLMSKMDFTEDLDFSEIYNEQYLSFPKVRIYCTVLTIFVIFCFQILRHQLSCCTWYLIWDWRKSIKHGHNQNMLKGFHDYISYLERYLDNRNDEVVREVSLYIIFNIFSISFCTLRAGYNSIVFLIPHIFFLS